MISWYSLIKSAVYPKNITAQYTLRKYLLNSFYFRGSRAFILQRDGLWYGVMFSWISTLGSSKLCLTVSTTNTPYKIREAFFAMFRGWRREWLAQIHSPLLMEKVDYGIGLSYRPASQCSLTGRYNNLYNSQLYPPSRGLWIGPLNCLHILKRGCLNTVQRPNSGM